VSLTPPPQYSSLQSTKSTLLQALLRLLRLDKCSVNTRSWTAVHDRPASPGKIRGCLSTCCRKALVLKNLQASSEEIIYKSHTWRRRLAAF
jgi:hypothetical protein